MEGASGKGGRCWEPFATFDMPRRTRRFALAKDLAATLRRSMQESDAQMSFYTDAQMSQFRKKTPGYRNQRLDQIDRGQDWEDVNIQSWPKSHCLIRSYFQRCNYFPHN